MTGRGLPLEGGVSEQPKCAGCGRVCRKIADGSYACPSCEDLEFME